MAYPIYNKFSKNANKKIYDNELQSIKLVLKKIVSNRYINMLKF
jgi:hypothetical protein